MKLLYFAFIGAAFTVWLYLIGKFLIPLIKLNQKFILLKEMKGSYDSGGAASKLITHELRDPWQQCLKLCYYRR